MLQEASRNRWQKFLPAVIGAVLVAAFVGFPSGRDLLGRFFRSLRMQKVQAVNVALSSFTDPNANPALPEMVAKMISDTVVVRRTEKDQQAPDSATAASLAGFPVQLLGNRKDPPKLV